MDASRINWAEFGLVIITLVSVVWLFQVFRRKAGWIAFFVSLAMLVTAAINSAAPWRGLIDTNYVGYGFGYLKAEPGWMVTAVAGSVFVLAVAGAFAALQRGRTAMALTALVSLFFAINVGGPWLKGALTDPASNAIQFGEYLTIPGAVGTGLLFVLMILPFIAGAVWAGRRTLQA